LVEIATLTQQDFVELQRPMTGFTLEKYISSMGKFNKKYKGKLILDITFLAKYLKNEKAIEKLKEIINRIKPEEYFFRDAQRKI